MKHVTITAVVFLLAITQGSADFQCPSATFVELGKDVLIDCLITDVNDIYWLRGTEEDHYPIVKIEMGLKTISKVAQDHFDITDTGALVIRNATNDLTGSYVMLHYRTNHVKEVDTVTLNVTKLIDSIITQGPSGGVYPLGSTITLSCTFQKGYVVGWKEFENKDIFVADTKVTANTKYDNFRVSLSDGISSLLIIGADLEDAGDYSCNTKSYAHVEIEAPPSLRIMFNITDDEGTNSTDSYGVIDITCTARNARPAVMIRFKTDGSEWIKPSETWTVSKGMTFDTSATLKYNIRTNRTDAFITCQSFGQTSVSAMEKTIHLYLPICNITISGNEVRCRCKANPPVDTYRMELNGNLQDGDVLYIEESNSANVTCFGTNGMGTGRSSILFPGDKAGFGILPIVVTISVAVVLMVLAVIYIRRRLSSRSGKPDAEQLNEDKTREPFLPQGAHEENPPEDIKGNQAEHNMTENSPIDFSDTHFSAAVSSNETSGSNKEISNGKDVDFEKTLSPPSKPDSSSSTIEQACDITDPQKFISKILLQVNKDWEIFAIEVLDISEKVVEEAVMKNDNFKSQIAVIIEEITAKHIQLMDEITKNEHPKKRDILSEFNLECVKEEGRYYFRNPDITQSYPSKSEDIIDQTDPHSIESRDEMITSCMDRIGRVGICRLLAASDNIETEVANIFKMEETKTLLVHLSKCHLFQVRKIVLAHSNTELWNYINILCKTISVDWEIFAVEVLKLKRSDVIDIIEHTKDNSEQVLGMFQKWRAKKNEVVSKQDLESLFSASKYTNMILSENNSQQDAAIKVKTTNEGPCSDEVLKMITNCNMRIGSVGWKRLGEAYTSFESSTISVVFPLLTSSKPGAIKDVSVDDSVESLWKLCRILYRASLLTARNVVIHFIENELHNEISMVLKARASDWDNVAMRLFSLSKLDIVCIGNAASSNEERLRMAISKWMRITDEDVQIVLKEKAVNYPEKTDGTSMLTMLRP